MAKKDLTGMTFGRLTVTGEAPSANGRVRWRVACACGVTTKVVHASNLVGGRTVSCGCYHGDALRARAVHGHGRRGQQTTEHACWIAMRHRCNPSRRCPRQDYAGRGTRVCSRWDGSFAAFFEDMGPKPSPTHSIDRKDYNGGYWCGKCAECAAAGRTANCRWATRAEQANNKSNNRLIEIDGQTKTMTEWSAISGVGVGTIWERLKRGLQGKDAVFMPVRQTKRVSTVAA